MIDSNLGEIVTIVQIAGGREKVGELRHRAEGMPADYEEQ